MNFKNLANVAKKTIDKRGGTDALKQDLGELQKIAKGKGTPSEKAKQAAAALKEPGGPAAKRAPADTTTPVTPPADTTP